MRAQRVVDVAVAGGGVLLASFFVFFVCGWGSPELRIAVTDGVYLPITLLGTVLAVRVVRRRDLPYRVRLSWRFMAVAYVCQLGAHVAWFVQDAIMHAQMYPAVADYLFLAFVPFMLAGLLLLPGRRSQADRIRLVLDSLIVGASGFMVLWYLVLGPILTTPADTPLGVSFSAALPTGDGLLILAVASLLLRRSSAADLTVRLLAGAVTAFVVADVSYTYVALHGFFQGGMWMDLVWTSGNFLLVLAARHAYGHTGVRRTAGARHSAVNWMPYGAMALAYALLTVIAHGQGLYPLGGMIVGAVVLTGLVVARQMYALRENRQLAITDALTGLANRNLVGERMAQLMAQPLRDDRCAAVLLIDLDHFKPINDAYGHEAGDAVLAAAAATLRSVLRPGDTAGRLGGDEFAVLLPNLPDPAAAERIAERLVDALRTPVIFGEHLLGVEASIGVAVRDRHTTTADELIHRADTAMYAAKRSGRSRAQVYTPDLDTRARDAELRRAIAGGELVVHYQPVVRLDTGEAGAVEALVRWNHPEHGLLLPEEFIGAAEEHGAIVPLGEWVLREACRQAAEWRRTLPDLVLTVNLSPRQVVQPDLVPVIRGILAETGFPAGHLGLELTEGVILEPDEAIVCRLHELKDMGVRLAVDDFGTGYSALSYLRLLPVQVLKIDRTFVSGIADDPKARTVAEAVIRLGEAFGLVVVAEGVETAEQAATLRDLGCRFAQGFHFRAPADAATTAAHLVPGQTSAQP